MFVCVLVCVCEMGLVIWVRFLMGWCFLGDSEVGLMGLCLIVRFGNVCGFEA